VGQPTTCLHPVLITTYHTSHTSFSKAAEERARTGFSVYYRHDKMSEHRRGSVIYITFDPLASAFSYACSSRSIADCLLTPSSKRR